MALPLLALKLGQIVRIIIMPQTRTVILAEIAILYRQFFPSEIPKGYIPIAHVLRLFLTRTRALLIMRLSRIETGRGAGRGRAPALPVALPVDRAPSYNTAAAVLCSDDCVL